MQLDHIGEGKAGTERQECACVCVSSGYMSIWVIFQSSGSIILENWEV